jgi:hypothetical protein
MMSRAVRTTVRNVFFRSGLIWMCSTMPSSQLRMEAENKNETWGKKL